MKKALPYLAIGVALIAILLIVVFHKKERHFDGRITLNPTQKIPYGSYVAYQLLQQQFPRAKVSISKEAPGDWKVPANDTSGTVLFVLVNYFNPTTAELDSLTSFARKGNNVVISALEMSRAAQKFFHVKEDDVYDPYYSMSHGNNTVSVLDSFSVLLDSNIFSQRLQFSYPGVAYDNRFKKFDSAYVYPLGYNKQKAENLLALRTLKGAFILHSAPITFSNLFLLYSNNHVYFEKLMSLLPDDTKYVLWDEYFMYRKSSDNREENSILHVLLKYKNFRWAFWLSLIVLALYVFTEVKRRQRLQPEYSKPSNDTLTFVSTIGKLYFEKGDHKNLAEKLSIYFLDFVRTQYKISTAEINSGFAQALASKSNLPAEEIRMITDMLIFIRVGDTITQQQLMDYHRLLENFYSKI